LENCHQEIRMVQFKYVSWSWKSQTFVSVRYAISEFGPSYKTCPGGPAFTGPVAQLQPTTTPSLTKPPDVIGGPKGPDAKHPPIPNGRLMT
jgi:hypothetical protein